MEIILVILIIVLIIVVGLLYTKLNGVTSKMSDMSQQNQNSKEIIKLFSDSLGSKMSEMDTKMEERMNVVKEHVSKRLTENIQFTQTSTKEVNDRLNGASKVIGELREKLSAFEEGSKRIYDLGKDISELQNILKAPKLRGGFGEWMLEELLKERLPRESYEIQYAYKSRDIVDAIIKLQDGFFLPIDSKFPLENFKKLAADGSDDKAKELVKKELVRDIKKHVDDIARKYISKEEGSLDVALMYIPAENIYYETIVREDDILNVRQYCFSKNVVPVSPSTLFAYIQIIILGMRGMQVSKKAKEILNTIKVMESEFAKVTDSFDVVGKHLSNAQSKYDDTNKILNRFETRLQGAIALSDANVLEDEIQAKLQE